MVSALVLLNVTRNKINDVAGKLAEVHGITAVYSVAGEDDGFCWASASHADRLASCRASATSEESKVQGLKSKVRSADFGHWTLDFGPPILGLGLWTGR